ARPERIVEAEIGDADVVGLHVEQTGQVTLDHRRRGHVIRADVNRCGRGSRRAHEDVTGDVPGAVDVEHGAGREPRFGRGPRIEGALAAGARRAAARLAVAVVRAL